MSIHIFTSIFMSAYLARGVYKEVSQKSKENQIEIKTTNIMKLASLLNKGTWFKMLISTWFLYNAVNIMRNGGGIGCNFNDSDRDLGCYDRDDPQNEAYKAAKKVAKAVVEAPTRKEVLQLVAPPSPAPQLQNPPELNKTIALGIEPFEMDLIIEHVLEAGKTPDQKMNDVIHELVGV